MSYRNNFDSEEGLSLATKIFRYGGIAVAALIILTIGGCVGLNTVAPNAGFQAVLVKKPLIFGQGGIDPTPVKTGRVFVAPSTEAIFISTQPIQAHIEFADLMTSDGVPLSFDAVTRLQVTDTVELITRFGEGWYANNVEREIMNLTRQAVRKRGMNETAISSTAIEAIDYEVKFGVDGKGGITKYLHDIRMPVNLIDFTVGKANPPSPIKSQRIETAQQQQRILTEQQTKLAEDARKMAEESRAAADNAYRNQMGLSPDQFLQLENIKMQDRVCSNGAKCTFIANAGKSQPILDAR